MVCGFIDRHQLILTVCVFANLLYSRANLRNGNGNVIKLHRVSNIRCILLFVNIKKFYTVLEENYQNLPEINLIHYNI